MNPMMADRTPLQVVGGSVSQDIASVHRQKRSRRDRLWRHPLKRSIEVPYRVAAAIAVMEMGITEYSVIADAVGLSIEEVERVDCVEDTSVRQLALRRIPIDVLFKLENHVRCPRCQAEVALAPCVACRSL